MTQFDSLQKIGTMILLVVISPIQIGNTGTVE